MMPYVVLTIGLIGCAGALLYDLRQHEPWHVWRWKIATALWIGIAWYLLSLLHQCWRPGG